MIASEFDRHRQEFPSLDDKVFFNFGGQGPLPRAALDAIVDAYDKIQREGPFGESVNAWLQEQSALTRQAIAAELGTSAAAIALTENVTAGCNIALWGTHWQAGDRVLLTDCEHPGIIAAVQEISARFGVAIDVCSVLDTLNDGDPVVTIARGLQDKTRMVVLSHLLWNTGQVLPLAAISALCRDRGVRVMVDAAQSVGSLPLDLDAIGADYYAFTGHKWLCGPAGVGGLFVRPEILSELSPTFIGWRGITIDRGGQPTGWQPDSRRYELATSAYPQYIGLSAAIATHNRWGTPAERYARICDLSEHLWERLSELGGLRCLRSRPPEAGLVSFQLESGKHARLVRSLENDGFFLRTIAHPDCVRACTHYLTREDEIDRLVEAIGKRL
ncbi:Selenocysteine lyase [Rubidibacter lacunae KORDI 51-2]|uniref:Selenocysteine lyase n=1 Tax=Rubidibacter lacunae KORDI 51-2 TaxID=582515 RepID=U5DNM8_9CHRO|nr:aminotransferase class V-fold PLP-dependent enzyme [Rubidibacter lacunae]ERN41310.1 Selenocysteine lyase [Rubidibacter lacunae KORDI 51-2]